MITQEQIWDLKLGESITDTFADNNEKQRIRNYCHLAEGEFETRTTPDNGITVTKVSNMTRDNLTNTMKQMEVGEIIYPLRSGSSPIAAGTADHLNKQFGYEYEVRKVVMVRRVK